MKEKMEEKMDVNSIDEEKDKKTDEKLAVNILNQIKFI